MITTSPLDRSTLAELVTEHRRWLSDYPDALREFEKLLNGDFEAAMMEAKVRRFLEENDVTVQPAVKKNANARCPDFLCHRREYAFFVEVTCITIAKVVECTSLPYHDEKPVGARPYSNLNAAIWSECGKKVRQCVGLPHPALVAIGTHHFSATASCFSRPIIDMLLTGTTMITARYDEEKGRCDSDHFLSTDLTSAVFLRPIEQNRAQFARSPISGILTCGMGSLPPIVHCLLHPNPVHAFDESVLPNVPVGEVMIDQEFGSLRTVWRDGPLKKGENDVNKICELFN